MSVPGAGRGSWEPAQLLQLTRGEGGRSGVSLVFLKGLSWEESAGWEGPENGGASAFEAASTRHPEGPWVHQQGARQPRPRPPDSRKSPQNHA